MQKTTDKKCTKCQGMIVTRTHNDITEKMLKKTQFFSQWDYCLNCHTIWYDPKYIVLAKDYLQAAKYDQELRKNETLFFNL